MTSAGLALCHFLVYSLSNPGENKDRPSMEYRLGRADDLAACRDIVARRQPGVVDPALLSQLDTVWAGLLAEERLLFYVVVPDRHSPPVGFHMSAFVGEHIIDELRTAERAGIGSELLARHTAGERVFLDAHEIALHNSNGGLNLFVLHCVIHDDDLTSSRAHAIASASARGFFFTHSGYRTRRFIEEVFDDAFAGFLEAGGMGPWDEYRSPATVLQNATPRLYGLRAEQIAPGAGSPWGEIFHCPTSRFHFTPAEQRVLNQALLDASDEEIATELSISQSAVRQAWRGVFQRVSKVAPTLIGATAKNDSDTLVRGKEKRRKILAHLRQHPQELRPIKRTQEV